MTIRSILLSATALAVVAGCDTGTPPPKTDAEKLAMATEIAELMSDPKMIDQMVDGMAGQMTATTGQVCSSLPAEQAPACQERMASMQPILGEIVKEAMDEAKAMMPEFMKDYGAIMAREYTGEELAAMKDYYSSPEGKSVLQKQPAVMTEYMGKVMERMGPMQAAVARKTVDRLQSMSAQPN
jgi:hypothetical protein